MGQTPNLKVSLEQSGKSRSDLWQLAGLVALEQAVERANRACDLDFHARQQVTLLEGRDKCEMKLTKPLKFRTGRRDCKTEEDRKYVTQEHEVGQAENYYPIFFSFSCIPIHGE